MAASTRITGSGGRNPIASDAHAKVPVAVSTVARLLAWRDSHVQLSAPIKPPIDSAISTQPRCAG